MTYAAAGGRHSSSKPTATCPNGRAAGDLLLRVAALTSCQVLLVLGSPFMVELSCLGIIHPAAA